MTLIVNHLRDADTQNLFLEIAYGRHIVTGDLEKSLDNQASPKDIYVQHKFGKGEWEGFENLYWRGFSIPMTDFAFHPGTLSTGNSDPVQGVDAIFDKDIPHNLTVWGRAKLPHDEIQDFDITKEAPTGLFGIAKTRKVNIFNSSGVITDFLYSESAANQLLDLYLKEGKRAYSRIDFGNIDEWRSFMAEQILCDYRAISGIVGFGLTASYYNGANFQTFVSNRVDPLIIFANSDGFPAYGLTNPWSARFEGYVKPRYTEDYTFEIVADNGVRLWIDDVLKIDQWTDDGTHANGTYTTTVSLTAGQFHKVKIDWNNEGGVTEMNFSWESASQAKETVPAECLYPKEKYVDRYSSHIRFTQPTRLDDAVRILLANCNSTYQRVNGKYRFFCYEMLEDVSFTFDEELNFDPKTVNIEQADPTKTRNVFSGTYLDLDSRFLEVTRNPALVEFQDLIDKAGRRIDGSAIEFQNTTRFQAQRLLQAYAERQSRAPERITFTGNCESYPVLKSDRVLFNNEFNDLADYECRVARAVDKSSEKTPDEREFELVKWV